MNERKYDERLNISTIGIREQKEKEAKHHNRYEATPYEALDVLFQTYTIKKNDQLVDFGCGRGRTMFYIHDRFQIPVKGIEANDKTFEEALSNYESYQRVASHLEEPIQFIYGLAEDIEVEPVDNLFYLFNPFSLQVFKKVVANIMKSIDEHPRKAEIIFYYPLRAFDRYLREETPFERVQQIDVPNIHGRHGKFFIYRHRRPDDS